MRNSLTLLAVVAAFALPLAGCGGESDEPRSPAAPTTQTQSDGSESSREEDDGIDY